MDEAQTERLETLRKQHSGKPRRAKVVAAEFPPTTRILFVAEVAMLCRCSPRTIWQRVAENTFPAPFKLGVKAAWRLARIEQWLEAQQPVKG